MGFLQQLLRLPHISQGVQQIKLCQQHMQRFIPSLAAYFLNTKLDIRYLGANRCLAEEVRSDAKYTGISFVVPQKKNKHILCGIWQRSPASHGWTDRDHSCDGHKQKFCSDGNPKPQSERPLKLMDFQQIAWPHIIKIIRAKFLTFLIRSYFDEEFSNDTFLDGALQAVCMVSRAISNGNFDLLDGLVSREAIFEIRRNFDLLTPKQKKFVQVSQEDVLYKFIHEIGMIFDDQGQRFVEVTAVFHGYHGYGSQAQDIQASNTMDQVNIMMQKRESHFICNYRFLREYTKGVEDDWTINKLNHFATVEMVAASDNFGR